MIATANKVIGILNTNYGFQLDSLPEDVSFCSLQKENQSFDSLTRIQFLIEVEDALGIELPANAKIDCINDIEKCIGGEK